MRSFTTLFALLLASSTLLACSSSDDGTAEGEDDYRSHPKGKDPSLASLRVDAPAGTSGDVLLPNLQRKGKTGDLLDGLQPGRVDWQLSSFTANVSSSTSGVLTLASGDAATVSLAGMRVTWPVKAEASYGLWSPLAAPMYFPVVGSEARSIISVTAKAAGDVVAVAPGRYAFTWGFTDGVIVDAPAGTIASADLGSHAGRRLVRYVPPVRELPDACSRPHVLTDGSTEVPLVADAPLLVGQNDELGKLIGKTPLPLSLTVGCLGRAIPLPQVAAGAAPQDWKPLGRLDVDDVEITLLNGTKQTRRATYSVYDATTKELVTRNNDAFPTNTGIDLPTGKYHLVVSYTNNIGKPDSYTEDFTIP